VVFFDGKIEFQGNRDVVYRGSGSIYASDTITIRNFIRFCGVLSCGPDWDPNTNLLTLVGGSEAPIGLTIENNSTWQGAIYVKNDFSQGNSVIVCGPVIAQELFISNNTDNCFVPFDEGADGMPGNSIPTLELVNVPDSYTTD